MSDETNSYDRYGICSEATYEVAELSRTILERVPPDEPVLRALAVRIRDLNDVLVELVDPKSEPTKEHHRLVYATFKP